MVTRSDQSGPAPAGKAADETYWVSQAVTSPIGPITLTGDGIAIVRVEWRDSEPDPNDSEGSADHPTNSATAKDPITSAAVDQLRRYFEGQLIDFDLPISFGHISDVATAVLTTLAKSVEYGSTVTYGELADRSGTGIPARAVGGIMGLNPLPIIVPCHRVVASDGLGGYSGGLPGRGLETKRWLLEFEDALPRPLF
ncbi:methylated-DNA--[protein]-cysteine S-methyltransferase [Brevibacterium zhoupengii]|uniref:methylated-DNA--[protein]-cysteine S-methyltransferase n=1 Tax=Brevibacterium zhoupengii TaxID=2898795 RepID=UPI001E654211|nr:methylated-DNA--[protein]-cysteine S-methyltransferase [Brevibacterium zhoupengii]